jgi:hypothetical protein
MLLVVGLLLYQPVEGMIRVQSDKEDQGAHPEWVLLLRVVLLNPALWQW